jgi:diguanylate cyclase (GGDEF)-like protein
MTREAATFRAAFMRVLFAILAAALLQLIYPKLADKRIIFIIYALESVAMLALVWKNIAPRWRPVVGGIIDMCFITWISHRVGSASTPVVAFYVVAGTLNGLVVGFRVAMTLAAFATSMYCAILVAEMQGWIAHGPDAPVFAPVVAPPDVQAVIAATVFVGMLTCISAILTAKLVYTIRSHEAELEELSQRDPLTHLYNRRHLLGRLDAEFARLRRGYPLSIVMLDLDGFKRINDRQGHLRGDALLVALSEALATTVRETDVVGRYGGDEFLIILPDTQLAEAELVADRVTKEVCRISTSFDPTTPVTASCGIAVAATTDSVRALVQRADENAYLAKQRGGNRVVVGDALPVLGPGHRAHERE